MYIVYDDSTGGEEDTTPAEITGVTVTVDGETHTSGNVTITPTSTITLTVTGTNLQNGTDDNRVNYADGFGQTVSRDYFEINEDGTTATDAPPVNFFANSSNFEIKYYNNYTDIYNRTAVPTGIYLTYDDGTGDEEPASCTCVTKCAEGSVNSECAVCSVEGADLSGCVGEEATADDEDGWFTVSGNTVTIDGTLGGKTTATEDDVNTLLEAIKGYVDSGITTIIVTGSNPAVIEVSGIIMPAVSEAIYRLSKEESYNGKIDLILQDVTEIMGWEFYDAFALNSITLPNVMKLGDSAFFGCRYLEKMTFGLVLTEIQNTSGATFYWVGEEVGGCDLVLNCGQMQGATDYQPNIGTDTWCYTEFKSITLAHTGGEATCTVQAVCSVCGDSYGELADHTTENDVCTLCGAMEIVVSFDAGDYNWETGDQIKLSRQSTDDYGNPVHTNYCFTATVAEDGTVTWTPDKSLYSDGTGEHTLAVSYPNMDLLYQNFGIPGDQSTLEKLREADCMNAIWSGNPTTDPITLNLTHRLAKVTVDYEVPEGVAVSKAEIYTLTQYLFFDFNTLERRDITGEEGDDLWINSYRTDNQFTAFVSPDAYAADGNFIKITLSDGTVREVKMTKAVTFEEGGEYTYKVIITADGAYLTCADECSFAYTDNGDGTHDATCTVCGAVVEDEAHSGGTATCTELAECQHCGASYGEVDADAHSYGDWVSNGDDTHTRICANDSSHTENGDCSGGTATCTTLAVCEACGASYGEVNANNHNWENGVCTYGCGITHDPHTFENGICTVCGKEDTTPAEITGVSITVDDVTYTEGDVTITPETEAIIVTVTGTHFANLSEANILDLDPGLTVFMNTWRWEIDSAANTATADFSDLNPEFGDHNGTEIMYSNDSNQNWTGTGIYLTYDDGTGGEEDGAPIITQQPTDSSAKLGDRFCVEVIARGEGLTYQWYFRNAGTDAWYKSSVTDNTYDDVMTTARAGREVYCVITDAHGNSVTTDTATLIAVKTAELAITRQPNDSSAKLGEMFCVEVLAEGDGLKYQWYWRQIGSEYWNVSGQKDNTYDDVMTSARHNREVYCVITDAWGDSVTTGIATITGTAAAELAITRNPESQTVTLGDMFNVNFDAVGDGLRYQWYFRQAGTEVWHTSGQKDNSYDDVMTMARHNRELYCVVTDAWGNTVETSPVVVIMAAPRHELAITAQPENESAKLGDMFCVTVEAQGDELRYQWYWRNVGSETWYVSGQRDNTYDDVMTRARHNREVKCVITDMWGNSVETGIATITGIPTQTLAIIQQPTDGHAKMGEGYFVEVIAQGDALTYQWYFKNAGTDVWHVSGVKDNTYDDVMTKARAGREVYCVVTDAWGHSVTTDTVTLVCN